MKEDPTATNQLKNMQEMANAPFGPGSGMTKEEYARQVREIEEAERKHHNEKEPPKMEPPRTPSAEKRRREEERLKAEAEEKRKQIMSRLIFHDFDYVNPISNLPEGDTLENVELRHQLLMQTSGSYGGFKPYGSEHSPGKSVYLPSDRGSDQLLHKKTRLGGHKSNIRALKNVQPMVKKKELSPGLRTMMKERFSSLEPGLRKQLSPKKLPKIESRKK